MTPQGPTRGSRKHALGILDQVLPAQTLEILINGVDHRIKISGCPTLPAQYGIQQFLPHLPVRSYRFQVRGGGIGSVTALIPRLIYNLFRRWASPQILKQIRAKYPLIGSNDKRKPNTKRPGGPKSRARYQKSYR